MEKTKIRRRDAEEMRNLEGQKHILGRSEGESERWAKGGAKLSQTTDLPRKQQTARMSLNLEVVKGRGLRVINMKSVICGIPCDAQDFTSEIKKTGKRILHDKT
ncbi:hypothetical protein ILYODFUR_024034 [Ilyodon furcidens]|uniref:Uncharacterized protein n=1 Tax=Ilyodon furcidens TaxID=33524 RepID=A0ABV0UYK3_9TELE